VVYLLVYYLEKEEEEKHEKGKNILRSEGGRHIWEREGKVRLNQVGGLRNASDM